MSGYRALGAALAAGLGVALSAAFSPSSAFLHEKTLETLTDKAVEGLLRDDSAQPSSPATQSPPAEASPPPATKAPAQRSPGGAQPSFNTDRTMVRDTQRMLNDLGYKAGPVDGIYGRGTRGAIQAFQRDHGQPATGDVTPRLLADLSAALQTRRAGVAGTEGREPGIPAATTGTTQSGETAAQRRDIAGTQTPRAAQPLPGNFSRPPPGIKPLDPETIDGKPVIAWTEDFHRLMDLILLGVDPGLVEDQSKAAILTRHLVDAERQRYTASRTSQIYHWQGRNEFERDDTARAFISGYGPVLNGMAPQLPRQLIYREPLALLEYDRARGGFPIRSPRGRLGAGFERDFGWSRASLVKLRPSLKFEWPEAFWPIGEAQARAFLQSQQSSDDSRRFGRRAIGVIFAAVLEVTGIELPSGRMDLGLIRAALYADDQLRRRLYEFPVQAMPDPYLLTGVPERLRASVAPSLDIEFAVVNAVGHHPELIGEDAWDYLGRRRISLDKATYGAPESLAGIADNDLRRPFFPRAYGDQLRDEHREAFKAFVKVQSASFAGEVVLDSRAHVSPETHRSGIDQAAITLKDARLYDWESVFELLEIQSDQVKELTDSRYDAPLRDIQQINIVLANSGRLYRIKVAPDALKSIPVGGVRLRTFLQVGRSQVVQGPEERKRLLIFLRPVRFEVSRSGQVIATGSFEHIPSLDQSGFAASAPRAVPAPDSGPIDFAGLDLLSLREFGDRLDARTVDDMIAAR